MDANYFPFVTGKHFAEVNVYSLKNWAGGFVKIIRINLTFKWPNKFSIHYYIPAIKLVIAVLREYIKSIEIIIYHEWNQKENSHLPLLWEEYVYWLFMYLALRSLLRYLIDKVKHPLLLAFNSIKEASYNCALEDWSKSRMHVINSNELQFLLFFFNIISNSFGTPYARSNFKA